MSESYCSQINDETVDFSVLAAEIGISLPSVAEPIVLAAMFRAVTDFLSKTRVFRKRIEIDYQQFTEDYPIETEECYSIITLEKVWFAGCEIKDFSTTPEGWLKLPHCYLSRPDCTSLEVEVVLSLSKDSCSMPKFIYERFGDGIMNMTLSRLYGMHGEDWYDPNLLKFYGGIGRQSISDAKTLLQQENNGGEIEIRGGELIL